MASVCADLSEHLCHGPKGFGVETVQIFLDRVKRLKFGGIFFFFSLRSDLTEKKTQKPRRIVFWRAKVVVLPLLHWL